LIDKCEFVKLVKEQNSDRYYKSFKSWDHLVTMHFGILSRCDSMAETCEGLKGISGKLVHMNLKRRQPRVLQALSAIFSVSRLKGLSVMELYIIDSTTIRLFSDLLKGVGRNPKGDGRKKGGLVVHMLIDTVQSVG